MAKCSFVMCGARKNKKQPHLTFHRFPRNDALHKKWVEAIGHDNINPKHKERYLYLCSQHFKDSCFNRTLEITRLRDDTVPTEFITAPNVNITKARQQRTLGGHQRTQDGQQRTLYGQQRSQDGQQRTLDGQQRAQDGQQRTQDGQQSTQDGQQKIQDGQQSTQDGQQKIQDGLQRTQVKQDSQVYETGNIQGWDVPCEESTVLSQLHPIARTTENIQAEKIKALQKRCIEQRRKIKSLNEQVRQRNKKIAKMKDIIKDLRTNNQIIMEQSVLMKDLAGPKDLLQRQIKKSKGLPLPKEYSEEVRKFALKLHFISPKAYTYVRQTYNTCLPHPRTLQKWYHHVNAEPGFSQEAIDTIKNKIRTNEHEQPVECSLVFEEMAVRKSLTSEPTDLNCDNVTAGVYLDTDVEIETSQALVVFLTCVDGSWKIPLGYYLIASLSDEQKSVILESALKLCADVGVNVVSITCDGPYFNMLDSGCDVVDQDNTTVE